MRPMKRFAAALMALAVICSAALLPQPAAALVTQADIDALKGDAKDLTAQRKALEEKLAALSDDKAEVMKKKELLDDQIAVQVSEIRNVESQISTYEDLIAQTQAELADAQQKEEIQYDLFCKRVRAMEEEGTVSYWSVLFKADSFTDLLDRLDAVNEVMDADQAVIDRLKALQDEGKFTELLMLQEELKTAPLGEIWAHSCQTHGVPADERWFEEIQKYEKDVLSLRK